MRIRNLLDYSLSWVSRAPVKRVPKGQSMLKSGEKLRKLLMLLATWGLLLAFFIAYERYFVMGQRDFLKEDGFRALATLSGELNSQIQKAQKSTLLSNSPLQFKSKIFHSKRAHSGTSCAFTSPIHQFRPKLCRGLKTVRSKAARMR